MFTKIKAILAIKSIIKSGKVIHPIELSRVMHKSPKECEALIIELINNGYLISLNKGHFPEYKTTTKFEKYFISLVSDFIYKWLPLALSIIAIIISFIALNNS